MIDLVLVPNIFTAPPTFTALAIVLCLDIRCRVRTAVLDLLRAASVSICPHLYTVRAVIFATVFAHFVSI